MSLGLPHSKSNHSKSNHLGSMSKKKKDWKTEKGMACVFWGGGYHQFHGRPHQFYLCHKNDNRSTSFHYAAVRLHPCLCAGVKMMLRSCLASLMHVLLSQQHCLCSAQFPVIFQSPFFLCWGAASQRVLPFIRNS